MKSLIESATSAPLQEGMCKDEELELVCRMCGFYTLVFPDNTDVRRNAYSLMLQSPLLLSRQYEQQLAELSIANLLGRVPGKIPFAWDDSKDYVHLCLDKDDAQSLMEELTELSEVNLRDAHKYLL